MIQRSESIAALSTALAKAQSEIEGATKDKTNPHFKSAYADLASVWDACRKALTKNGLAVVQSPSGEGPAVTVTTVLMHSSGEWLSGELTMTAQQNTPQGIGSCITYARRYALASMVGVAPEDDDGNAASQSLEQHEAERDRASVKVPAADKKTRQPLPEGAVYLEKVTPRSKGNQEWAAVVLSTGEEYVIRAPQLITLAMNIAQENVPAVISTTQNAKGKTQVDMIERWKPVPADPLGDISRRAISKELTAGDIFTTPL